MARLRLEADKAWKATGMKFGLYLIGTATGVSGPPAAPIADPEFLAGFARHAEEVGCDSLFFADHIVFPAAKRVPYPYAGSGAYPWDNEHTQLPEPLALMAFLAGVTHSLRFGTAVLVLPQRHPMLLAKQLATVDVLSGGRAELGIGAGWLADEFDALGYSFANRGARTDEYIDVMRELWANPVASFAGPTVTFDRVQLTTHPRQHGCGDDQLIRRVVVESGAHQQDRLYGDVAADGDLPEARLQPLAAPDGGMASQVDPPVMMQASGLHERHRGYGDAAFRESGFHLLLEECVDLPGIGGEP